MPETPSVSELVSGAVETAVAKHSEPVSQDGGASSDTPTSADTASASADAPADGARPTAASSVEPTKQAGDADGDLVKNDADWLTLDKRRTILQNARKNEREVFARELSDQLGVPISDQNAIANFRAFISDPAGYVRTYGKHFGLQVPEQTPQRQAQPQGQFERPKPRLSAEDGTPAYAAPEVDALVGHLEQQIAQMQQMLNPIKQTHQELQRQRVHAEAFQTAQRDFDEMKSWEGFDDVMPRMLELMKADGRVTPDSAYRRAYQEVYRPKLEEKVRKSVLDELKTSPAATPKGVSPTATARAAAKKPGAMSVSEAVLFAVEQASNR